MVNKPREPNLTRAIMVLLAVFCLSVGIVIGALVRQSAGAKTESTGTTADDNRLSISSSSTSPDSLSSLFARVALDVEPSVVHIKVAQGSEGALFTREGTGSGVIVNPSGFIITNQHVIRQASKITVKLQDGSQYAARVVGQDTLTDLAVIKIDPGRRLPVARMGDSDRLRVGDWVLAIGSPFGLEQTVTAGIISGKDRVAERGQPAFQQFLQTDAAINPGNSGGPLVNLTGEVVGINTQIATANGVFNGIGFALPSATAVDVYNQIVTNGRVRRGFLGVETAELTPQIARLNNITDNQGALVVRLAGEGSPAARAGLQSGDVIVSVNNQKVKSYRELIRLISMLQAGTQATITYRRGGQQHTAEVKLEERQEETSPSDSIRLLPFDPRNPRPSTPDEEARPKAQQRPTLGLNVKTLTPEMARQRGLEGVKGAYVVSVERDSIGDDNQIRPDDVVVEVNYRSVATAEDFSKLTRDLKSGDDVLIKVLRRDRGTLRRAEITSFTMP
jgi:serine protease Do